MDVLLSCEEGVSGIYTNIHFLIKETTTHQVLYIHCVLKMFVSLWNLLFPYACSLSNGCPDHIHRILPPHRCDFWVTTKPDKLATRPLPIGSWWDSGCNDSYINSTINFSRNYSVLGLPSLFHPLLPHNIQVWYRSKTSL